MKAVEADMTVARDGSAVIQLRVSPGIPAGKHRAVVVLDERTEGDSSATLKSASPVELPVHDFGPWPSNISLRREDMYGDHGR